jgi:hypothetical protein
MGAAQAAQYKDAALWRCMSCSAAAKRLELASPCRRADRSLWLRMLPRGSCRMLIDPDSFLARKTPPADDTASIGSKKVLSPYTCRRADYCDL